MAAVLTHCVSMKALLSLVPLLFISVLVGCSNAGAARQGTRPDDFRVEYHWREGSLPPPYHYEYTIVISPTGQSQIVLTPDYASAAPPKWVEDFRVSAERRDDLYHKMVDKGLFTQKWRKVDIPPVGGSNQTMVVTAGGKRITVEDYLVSEQQDSALSMYSAVKALVPAETWDRLKVEREQYIRVATTQTSIGVATMEPDGTIVLQLRAAAPGAIGDTQLRYPKGHKDYDAVLKHLGGLRPGESKPVPPWPDSR